ncbi:simnilar to predicted protein from Sclerotinia sclerotiorum [Golovinomyces cichoracearum]|uniref:Uncharacterized protein n=1 Tax=Golovinomyces cichoracearum TaxID=62708 RepID=A0A420J2J0_9PEZI|nr:simnilar to predicted protein from Sclerotinia sclerotiorum [Golovinomyces cichoracearum]
MADQIPHNINIRSCSPVKPLPRKGALPRTPPKVASLSDAPLTYPTSSSHLGRHDSDEEADTEKRHADTTKALQNQLSQYQKSQREVKFENQQEPRQREKSTRLYSQRHTCQPPLFPSPARLEKVPHLPEEQKLASSASSDAPMWRHAMTTRMNRYGSYFCDDIYRIEFIYENTKDEAAKFLRSFILDPLLTGVRLTLLTSLLILPSTKFRTLAADAEYRGDRFLREQLRSKVRIRLSNVVKTEWTRCHTLNDYVKVLQEADTHYQSVQHRQKRQAATFFAADERHSNFPSSSAIPKNQKQIVRSLNYKELNNTVSKRPENSAISSNHLKSSLELERHNQRGNSATSASYIYEVNFEYHDENSEDEDLPFAEEKSHEHASQAKDEAQVK